MTERAIQVFHSSIAMQNDKNQVVKAAKATQAALTEAAEASATQPNPVPATPADTPVLIPNSVAPENQPKPVTQPTEVVTVAAPDPLSGPLTAQVTINPAPATQPTEKKDMVKVKVLRSHPAFSYFAGEEGQISAEDFEKNNPEGLFFEKI
jgi:hypothetical protein